VCESHDELAERRRAKQIAQLSAAIGIEVQPVNGAIVVPADAHETVVENFWPGGEPLVMRTYFER
jgi:hypothetical protein